MQSTPEDTLYDQCRYSGLPEPQRQFRFHATRRFRYDFAWPAQRLLVDVQGGQWLNGHHNRPRGYEDDCVKHNLAILDGWRVLEFTPAMVYDGRALRDIERAKMALEGR